MTLSLDFIREQIKPLVEEVEQNRQVSSGSVPTPYYKASEGSARAMQTRMLAAVDRLASSGSAYAAEAERVLAKKESPNRAVLKLAGVLRALLDDYEAGYMRTVEELIHADVFADFLEMADELLVKTYKDPAAVLAGSVLEEHLRKLAVASGVAVESAPGKPKKADTINADLVKADVYNKLGQKSVTAWLDLRNSAAHGHYDQYDAGHVEGLIRDVRAFMVRYPA